MKKFQKIILFLLPGFIFFLVYKSGALDFLSFENLKSNKDFLKIKMANNPVLFTGLFFLVYLVTIAFSLPGAAILTISSGLLFGTIKGTIIASFASSIGATIAFLAARFFFKDLVEKKFGKYMASIQKGLDKDGPWYLFTMRLVPIFPFFIVNLLSGLTNIKTLTYYLVSQIGMLPVTFLFANTGSQLSTIDSPKEILSPRLILSFAIIGIFPILVKKLIDYYKTKKVYKGYKKPKKFDYNIIAIGAGAGGLVTSYIAAAVKAKVALIEKNKMGGDCLNTGCVPSKALIKSSKVFKQILEASKYGLNVKDFSVDFTKVMARVKKVIKKIEPHDSIERYEKLGVNCITGHAQIISPYEVKVNDQTITTKNIVIATGASPFVPPIKGIENVSILTSNNVWDLNELPKNLVILGGGPIGCELAQSFQRLGSNVTQVEMMPEIMGREDSDVSEFVKKKLESDGVKVFVNHKVVEFDSSSSLICETDNGNKSIKFDKIIIAIGRKPNTKGFGLEDLKLEYNTNGTIAHDKYLRTKYSNIYVCGDVAGPYQFTHVAAHQAWYASVNALFSPFKKFKVDYRVIPWCTFVDPEVSRVGINESEAKESKLDYEVVKYGIDDLDRAISDGNDEGFVKVILKQGSDKILGATIVGDNSSNLIIEFVTAMKNNIGLNKILGTIHLYPSMAEANKYVAGEWKRANQPEKLLKFVQKFHAWRRD